MRGTLSSLSMERDPVLPLSVVYSGWIPRGRVVSRQVRQEIREVRCEMDWAQ
jgi:hypothetical protein